MSDKRRSLLGRLGEMMAVTFLESKGYRILQRNFRSSEGELDIIGDHRGGLAFVEVRTRLSDTYGRPLETIGFHKQGKVRSLALQYLDDIGGWKGDIRFDALGILMREGEPIEYDLIQNAF